MTKENLKKRNYEYNSRFCIVRKAIILHNLSENSSEKLIRVGKKLEIISRY